MRIPSDPELERAELAANLGERYDEDRLRDHRGGVQRELAAVGSEERFYRVSEAYLYDLTAFAMSGAKLPYLELLTELLPPPARLLEIGCGIGSDGLLLAELGYELSFADFANPSTRYLRWRLDRRGLAAPVHDLDRGPPPGGHDAVFAFDVVEHVPDPARFLDDLRGLGDLAVVNLLDEEDDGEGNALHHRLAVGRLIAAAARPPGGIVSHSVHHGGRSHLVAYGARGSRLRSLLARARTRGLR